MKRIIVGLLFVFVSVSCRETQIQPDIPPHLKIVPRFDRNAAYRLTVVGGGEARDMQIYQIRQAATYLPQPILEHLPPFEIGNDTKHFTATYGPHVWVAAGHYCPEGKKICLFDSLYISPFTVWHESMHARDYYLASVDKSPIENWRKIAGDVYDEDGAGKHADRTCYQDGLLEDYCRWNPWEDRAVFFTECLQFVNGKENRIPPAWRLKEDKRFFAKLKALKEEGLFTEEEYQLLEPLFK